MFFIYLFILIALLIIVILFFCIKVYLYQNCVVKKCNLQVLPNKLPVIGHAHFILQNTKNMQNDLDLIAYKYSSGICGWIFNKLVVFVHSPEDAEVIFTKCMERGVGFQYIKEVIGDGLALAPFEQWKLMRRAIGPAFNPSVLNNYHGIIVKNADFMLNRLKLEEYKNNNADIFQFCSDATACITYEIIMGFDSEYSQKEALIYVNVIDRVIDGIMEKLKNPLYLLDFVYALSSKKKKDDEYIKKEEEIIQNIIKRKKEMLVNVNKKQDKKHKACLELLLESVENGTAYNETLLKDEVKTMMFAATHTSASAIFFALLFIAMNPKIQKRAYEEVMEVVGLDEQIKTHHLTKFEYIGRIIKETLRFFPIGAMMFRTSNNDLTLGNGKIIPKDTAIIINLNKIHMDEKTYKNPKVFNPDRFLKEESSKRHSYSYLPYGGGIRNCIGKKLSMLIMPTIIANLIRNFEFTTNEECKLPEDIKVVKGLFLKPGDGHQLKYTSRKL